MVLLPELSGNDSLTVNFQYRLQKWQLIGLGTKSDTLMASEYYFVLFAITLLTKIKISQTYETNRRPCDY